MDHGLSSLRHPIASLAVATATGTRMNDEAALRDKLRAARCWCRHVLTACLAYRKRTASSSTDSRVRSPAASAGSHLSQIHKCPNVGKLICG
jgi:hypothetical protein